MTEDTTDPATKLVAWADQITQIADQLDVLRKDIEAELEADESGTHA